MNCRIAAVVGFIVAFLPFGSLRAADVTIIESGTSRAAIFAPTRLLDDAVKNPEPPSSSLVPEDNRRRLRESVKDLAGVLERITGAKVEIVSGKPAADEKRLPILIGELATERFGAPAKPFPYLQGCRIVVTPTGIGLSGESDLATSYAIYTLLDQLGCRWYFPSPLGECLPVTKTISLPEQDLSTGPYTVCRGLWYCDAEFRRRSRLGGMLLAAGHALEMTVPKELRVSNPEIRAIVNGKPDGHRVKWTHPLVAQSIADACLAQLAKDPTLTTFSLSPDDGLGWDESDDAKLDAGDFDPSIGAVSKTDRLMVLANRVAAAVSPKHPDVRFGILAYADYFRPPLREKVPATVVPQIAPITYSRAQPMEDDGEPNNKGLRAIVEGWAKVAPATSYYFYGYYLAEVSSPNPMITKWGRDIPYIYKKGNCRYWQPETLSNFESCMHGLYLGSRLAWNPDQDPQAIVQELHQKLYGAAAGPMQGYWTHIDDTWVKVPEYAGCGFGHLNRWTKPRLDAAREWLDKAKAACQTDVERARVQFARDSFDQFDAFMLMRRNLADGKFSELAEQAEAYRTKMKALGKQYEPQFAFARMGWTGESTLNVIYFDAFYKATYDDADRVATNFEILTPQLMKTWRFLPDKDKTGEAQGLAKPDFDDAAWKQTDCVKDTWSSIGLHNYMGSVWYRTRVTLPAAAAGKKTRLWIGATDGRVKVFVNGKHVPFVNDKGEPADTFSGHCQPASFDVTGLITSGENQVSLFCTREFMNELGTGGLIAPVLMYRDR